MTEKLKKGIPAPLWAVVAIGVCWVAVVLFRSGPDGGAPQEVPSPPEGPIVAEVPDPPAEPAFPMGTVFDSPQQSGVDSWPTYHGGPALTGLVSAALPDKPEVLWRYQASDSIYYAPVVCDDRIIFTDYDGTIIALDWEGNEAWSRRIVREIKKDGTERMERFDAPVACFESTVLTGSMSGKLFALDAASGETKWIYEVGGPMLGTVNLIRSGDALRVLALGQNDGSLRAIDLESGALAWQTESIDRCDGSVSVWEDSVVFGSCAAALHVFSASDGAFVRNIEFDGDSQVAGGVAIAGDSAFSGSNSGRVFHVNIRTGEIVWTNEDSLDEVFTTPAVSSDRVVFTSYDGNVYAVDRGTGVRLWTFETPGVPSSPVIAGDRVVFGSNGVLYLLDVATGEEVWSYEVSDEITSPAIVNGKIIVGSDDGTVTVFGAPGSQAK